MSKPFTSTELSRFNKIKKLTLDVVYAVDNKKGLNIKRYEEMFKAFEADPDAFRKWDVLNNKEYDSTIQIFALPFEEPKMNQIKKAADILNIELENYIYYRQNDPRGIRSKMKVPVGYVHIKRVQQLLSKKNHYTFDMDTRSLKTGDVKGHKSKCASLSDNEMYALSAIGADKALEELLGPRADNIERKRIMYKDIAVKGYTTLESMKNTKKNSSTTLNTINTYLIGAGIRSDLITNSLKTEYTLDKDLKKK